jgi:hypothetical protein
MRCAASQLYLVLGDDTCPASGCCALALSLSVFAAADQMSKRNGAKKNQQEATSCSHLRLWSTWRRARVRAVRSQVFFSGFGGRSGEAPPCARWPLHRRSGACGSVLCVKLDAARVPFPLNNRWRGVWSGLVSEGLAWSGWPGLAWPGLVKPACVGTWEVSRAEMCAGGMRQLV